MVEPKQVAGYKSEKRRVGNEEVSTRLSQRLRNRFTQCFATPSPPPLYSRRGKMKRGTRPTPLTERTAPRESLDEPLIQDPNLGEEVQLDLDSLACNSSNFEALLNECKMLRRKQNQLTQDMSRVEQRAVEVAKDCCSIVTENNNQLHHMLHTTEELDRLVKELKSQISERDQVIKELEDQHVQRHAETRQGPGGASASDSGQYRND